MTDLVADTDGLRSTSNSEIRTFKRCRRKWWLGYYQALGRKRPEVSGARAIGTRLHAVFAAYYDPANEIGDQAACLTLWDRLVDEDTQRIQAFSEAHEDDPAEDLKDLGKDATLGRAMIEGYFEWLEETGADSDLEVIGSERGVRVPLLGSGLPVALVAKLDLRVRRRSDGARLFLDHKSVDNFTVPAKVAHIDEQFLMYSLIDYLEHLAAGTGSDATFTDGGIFNWLRKVKRTKAAKPPFFERMEIRHNRDELRSFWYRVAGEIGDILAVEAGLRAGADHRQVAYPNPTRDCHWDCDFFTVCRMLDDPNSDAQALLDAHYEPTDPYQRYRDESPAQAPAPGTMPDRPTEDADMAAGTGETA